ncbi:hypothetical protein M8J75_010189 [Diaphorina citri]|nr:hypothetical protein M8J75_010189 [Diaphorina citri]
MNAQLLVCFKMPSVDSMGPLSTKLTPTKVATKSEGTEEGIYFAVYIPSELLGGYENEFSECERVFDNKEEALLFIKKNKKIRFKSFRNFQDAQNFAYHGSCGVNTSLLEAPASPSTVTAADPSALPQVSSLAAAEKPSPFKSLKSQELVKLRKLIEKGNLADVRKLVWDNPRYLVSSGDFPTILHEGCRYNALHVSTKAVNPAMTEMLLEIIGNPAFTNLLYDSDTPSYIERSDILLDLYVNTPDKALNETPLHFAAKFGSVECVKRLIGCAKIQTSVRNKEGKTPLDVVCSRCSGASEDLKSSIRKLLSEDQYYVPIWRSSDACDIPLVGTPCKTNVTPNKVSIRRDENDITSPTLEIKAFAGPMNETDARNFRTKWKREMKNPDLMSSALSTPSKYNSSHNNSSYLQSPPTSVEKSFELVGIMLVSSALSTPSKYNSSHNNSSYLQSPPTSVEKSFELVGRRLALENKFEWKEHWPFLNKCIDLQSSSGLDLLENYLHTKLLDTVAAKKDETNGNTVDQPSVDMISPIEKLCVNFDTLSLSSHSNGSPGSNSSSVTSISHLLIEKSCEVFAKRLLQGLKNAAFDRNRGSLVRILRQEAKHLNNLCTSFTQDQRFQAVSLNRLHSTIAKCLGSLLATGCPPECVDWILRTFSEIANRKLLFKHSLDNDSPSMEDDKSHEEDQDNTSVLCLITQILNVLGFNSSDSNIAEEHSDNLAPHGNSTGDIIRGTLLNINNRPRGNPQDDGSYNNNNNWSSDNSNKHASSLNDNKLGSSLNDNKLGSSLNDNKLGSSLNDNKLGSSLNDNKLGRSLNDNKLGSSLNDNKRVGNLNVDNGRLFKSSTDIEENRIRPQYLAVENQDVNRLQSCSFPSVKPPRDLYVSSGSEKEAERNWNLCAACQCTRPAAPRNLFSNIRSYNRFSYRAQNTSAKGKRIDFDQEDRLKSSGAGLNALTECGDWRRQPDVISSDSSDTDDEYFTPPGSFTEQSVVSSSEEEMMDANDEDIEVFLVGNSLSATDVDVLQTLSQCGDIDCVRYPNIYKWRHLVMLKLNQETINLHNDTASPATVSRVRYIPSPRDVTCSPMKHMPSPRQLFSGSPVRASPVRQSYRPLQHSTPSFLES